MRAFISNSNNERIKVDQDAALCIGRKTLLGINTQKCSKEHLEISIVDDKLFVERVGGNPSFLQPAGTTQHIVLDKNVKVEIHHGDKLYVLANEGELDVIIESSNKRNSPDAASSDPPPSASKRVRRILDEEDEDHDNAHNQHTLPDTQQPPPIDDLPVCQWGTKCFRKNPAHFAEYSHPWRKDVPKPSNSNSNSQVQVANTGGHSSSGTPQPTAASSPTRSQPTAAAAAAAAAPVTPLVNTVPRQRLPNPPRAPSPPVRTPRVASVSAASPVKKSTSSSAPKPTVPSTAASSSASPHVQEYTNQRDDDVDDENQQSASDQVLRLAFPSLSTLEYGINLEKAAPVAAMEIEKFLSTYGGGELVLVDSDASVAAAYDQAVAKNPRFRTLVGDISSLKSGHDCVASHVAMQVNWAYKPTFAASIAISSKVPALLSHSVRETLPTTINTGQAYSVPLANHVPLCAQEGVSKVLIVCPPNMNLEKPDPIEDEVEALRVLGETYRNLFGVFAQVGGIKSRVEEEARKSVQMEVDSPPLKVLPQSPPVPAVGGSSSSGGGAWSDALLKYAKNPEKYPNEIVYYDDDISVMRDGYPKAKYHFLVMPRVPMDGLASLKPSHIPLLHEMEAKGKEIADSIKVEDPKAADFKMGFHAIPSMKQLHLHVISQDFVSDKLKHRKHWVSFNSSFFKSVEEVVELLEAKGRVHYNKAEYEDIIKNGAFRCPTCGKVSPDLPKLKTHLKTHR
ncbi:hypothetical protein SmJEL517_g05853 [Synchytrium microbalum]|uniref:Aprataxin n=1 Tax=Synchytrium microbalum TaxID=1806994 RepID=A0A507BY26_9FUNG|nr:uncharacterized protein SmJEL517_g05853 [Synchytrium microbalum]TPX30626.1 hypothetical protein SmJEL517_g05853 [Synchytrium microbalum]